MCRCNIKSTSLFEDMPNHENENEINYANYQNINDDDDDKVYEV